MFRFHVHLPKTAVLVFKQDSGGIFFKHDRVTNRWTMIFFKPVMKCSSMTDFTIESMQQCMEWETKLIKIPSSTNSNTIYMVTAEFMERRHRDSPYHCTCDGFKYRGHCKHVQKVMDENSICDWHELVGDPGQDEHQRENKICPKCGGKTMWVQVAV